MSDPMWWSEIDSELELIQEIEEHYDASQQAIRGIKEQLAYSGLTVVGLAAGYLVARHGFPMPDPESLGRMWDFNPRT